MRKKIVAGNWKMNMTPKEAVGLVNKLRDKLAGSDVEVVFCVPAIDIIPVVEAVKDTDIKVGAENMHYEEKGAFTGEISPGMLVDSGVSYVILGHSERRQYFGEDDDCINRKVRKAIEYGITPIICCGETIQQREEGITLDFIKSRLMQHLHRFCLMMQLIVLLLMSRYGLLVQAGLQHQSRHRKYVRL